jgi:hypothetical protein
MPVVTESDGADGQFVPAQNLQLLSRLNTPEPHRIIFCPADNASLSEGP